MERSRSLDVLVLQERERRERSSGRDIVPQSLIPAVEHTRAEIDRVLSASRGARLKLKNTQNA